MRRPFLAAIRQSQREHEPGVLIGVRAICAYTQIGTHTFYRWHREQGFPAALTPGGRWMTTKGLIEKWIIARWEAQRAEEKARREAQAEQEAFAPCLSASPSHPATCL